MFITPSPPPSGYSLYHTPPSLRDTSPILGEEEKCFACQGFCESLADGVTSSSPKIGEVLRSNGGVWTRCWQIACIH